MMFQIFFMNTRFYASPYLHRKLSILEEDDENRKMFFKTNRES